MMAPSRAPLLRGRVLPHPRWRLRLRPIVSDPTRPQIRRGRPSTREILLAEFDAERTALIEPSMVVSPRDIPRPAVMCFFSEVIEGIARRGDARQVAELRGAHGVHPIWEIAVNGERLAVFHPGVGAPLAAMFMEEAIGTGCAAFCACGGAGAVQPDLALGHVVIPDSALRDEGTSFHYLAPTRSVEADPRGVRIAVEVLEDLGLPYVVGRTWTTDAPYRETRAKIARRAADGCLTVEMEAAALFAVARFRNVRFAQLLYAGDSVAGDQWDPRGWPHADVREPLFWAAAEIALRLSH
jgi:uridine phosphorylase